MVCHRRRGKTTFLINHLQREALTLTRPPGMRIDDPPRVGLGAPLLKQAKLLAWEPLKRYARCIPGVKINESELWVEYPNQARFYVFGLDNPDAVRGSGFDRVALDEYGQMSPTALPLVIEPMLADRLGHLYVSGTPAGRNSFFKAWEAAQKDPTWLAVMHKVSDTTVIPMEEQIRLREQDPESFAQEFECSFAIGVKGAYYATLLEAAEQDGRIPTRVYHDPALEVYTGWDLGVGDSTCIWFLQLGRDAPRIIDYYASSGVGLDHYAQVLQEKKAKGYVFGKHFAPHDASQRHLAIGNDLDLVGQAASIGIKLEVLERTSVPARIQAARNLIPRMVMDATNCAVGLEGLKAYQRRYIESTGEYADEPLHNWASDPADAFGYLAQAIPRCTSRNYKPIKYDTRAFV